MTGTRTGSGDPADPAPGTEEEFERKLAIVRRWIVVIIVCGIVAGGVSLWVAGRSPVSYSSRAVVLVGPRLPLPSSAPLDLVLAGRALTPTYAELAAARPMLEAAIESAGVAISPEDLRRQLVIESDDDAAIIAITVTSDTPDAAAKLASGIAAGLEAYSEEAPGASSGLVVKTIEPAVAPVAPAGPGVALRAAIGVAIGMGIALAVAFLVENVLSARRWRELQRSGPAGP